MDTVTIDGVEYVKASVLAKAHKYTSDYIGQLCRGNKVDAHLVGRTWYVYPPSLEGHKSTRYAEARSSDKSFKIKPEPIISRRNVPTPAAKSTSRAQESNFSHRVFWRSPVYDEDKNDLLPNLEQGVALVKSTVMKVDLADSRRVNIAGRSDKVTMVSVPPPAIALAGTLKVQSYQPRFDVVEEYAEVSDLVEKPSYNDASIAAVEVENLQSDEVEPVKIRKMDGDDSPESDSKYVYNVPLKKGAISHPPLSFVPQSVKRREVKVVEEKQQPRLEKSASEERVVPDQAHSLFFNLVVAPAVVLLVVMVAGSFFFLESLTQVNSRGEQVKILNLNASLFTSILGPDNE